MLMCCYNILFGLLWVKANGNVHSGCSVPKYLRGLARELSLSHWSTSTLGEWIQYSCNYARLLSFLHFASFSSCFCMFCFPFFTPCSLPWNQDICTKWAGIEIVKCSCCKNLWLNLNSRAPDAKLDLCDMSRDGLCLGSMDRLDADIWHHLSSAKFLNVIKESISRVMRVTFLKTFLKRTYVWAIIECLWQNGGEDSVTVLWSTVVYRWKNSVYLNKIGINIHRCL